MTVEDRLRATTEAVTGAMRPIRPLNLSPDAAGDRAPAKRRLGHRPRRWPGWLVPVAAAVAVIAVAATLVAVKGLIAAAPESGSATPSSAVTLANGAPRYYAAESSVGLSASDVYVGDALTGKRVATFKPPSGVTFGAVVGSADGRTFVVEAAERPAAAATWSWHVIWYAIHLTPGATPQAHLTRIPVASTFTTGAISSGGLAVSPDGGTFAVVFRAASDASPKVTSSDLVTLGTYSVATGQLQRTWTAPPAQRDLGAFQDLSWLADGHTLAFSYPADASKDRSIRTLNVTRPGTDLLADSRVVFSVPAGHACDAEVLMTADGRSVICEVFAPNSGWCASGQFTLSAYSVATGKLERVLYQYKGTCAFGFSVVVWAKSAALAIGAITVSKSNPAGPPGPLTVMIGAVASGKFTSLPITVTGPAVAYEAPGAIAF